MINRRKFRFSLLNSINGLKYLFTTQNNFRIHLLATILVLIAGFLVKISIQEWLFLLFVIGLVWIVESINTVFERLFDLLDENYNPIIKIGKDVSAASVLICAVLSIIVGMLIFIPHLIKLLGLDL